MDAEERMKKARKPLLPFGSSLLNLKLNGTDKYWKEVSAEIKKIGREMIYTTRRIDKIYRE